MVWAGVALGGRRGCASRCCRCHKTRTSVAKSVFLIAPRTGICPLAFSWRLFLIWRNLFGKLVQSFTKHRCRCAPQPDLRAPSTAACSLQSCCVVSMSAAMRRCFKLGSFAVKRIHWTLAASKASPVPVRNPRSLRMCSTWASIGMERMSDPEAPARCKQHSIYQMDTHFISAAQSKLGRGSRSDAVIALCQSLTRSR